ncbi:MAG: GNAT family N-acetyltransferase [Emcibacter sp.]|nr:GNAT family N-acetyltransferase [Emcibacter sp.]
MTEHNPQDNDIFLEGEIVVLRQPDVEKDVLQGHWHSWFNDPVTTQYLVHGVFPVNREQQAEIVTREMADPSSLLLVVIDKATSRHIGVVCLKFINHTLRSAALSIVFGDRSVRGAPLEAVALLTKHAFDRLSLQRVYGGQHASLWQWMNSLELIGYRLDGYSQDYGIRNGETYDIANYAVTSSHFYTLQKQRDGNICTASLENLLSQKASENKTEIMKQFFSELYDG